MHKCCFLEGESSSEQCSVDLRVIIYLQQRSEMKRMDVSSAGLNRLEFFFNLSSVTFIFDIYRKFPLHFHTACL